MIARGHLNTFPVKYSTMGRNIFDFKCRKCRKKSTTSHFELYRDVQLCKGCQVRHLKLCKAVI